MRDDTFILEAKISPGQWLDISSTYPEMGIDNYFPSIKEVHEVKSRLKTALMTAWKCTYKKYPIRIRKV